MRVHTIPVALLGVTAGLATACSHPQRPYEFTQGAPPQRATAVVVDALAAEGLQAASVDPAGEIVTTWADTGYRLHDPPPLNELSVDIERNVLRRYHVRLVPTQAGGTMVRVEVEARRCAPDVTIHQERLLGDCQDVDRFLPGLQHDLDALGTKLRSIATLHQPSSGQAAGGQSMAQSSP